MTAATVTKHPDPILVETPFGRALCIAWLDWERGSDQEWECILLHNGAPVFVPHTHIRYATNYSLGVTAGKPPEAPPHMRFLKP